MFRMLLILFLIHFSLVRFHRLCNTGGSVANAAGEI